MHQLHAEQCVVLLSRQPDKLYSCFMFDLAPSDPKTFLPTITGTTWQWNTFDMICMAAGVPPDVGCVHQHYAC